MGLMDFIKGELIEIIDWTDDSRDTLSCAPFLISLSSSGQR